MAMMIVVAAMVEKTYIGSEPALKPKLIVAVMIAVAWMEVKPLMAMRIVWQWWQRWQTVKTITAMMIVVAVVVQLYGDAGAKLD